MRKRALLKSRILFIALLLAAFAGSLAAVAAPPIAPTEALRAPVEGTDYVLIDDPDPVKGSQVEVIEVFGYGCPICAALQPRLLDWEKTLPADVHFSYLPAAFGNNPEHCWDDFARAFYAAQSLGVQAKSHDNIYKAKFEQNRIETCADIPSVYADYGIDPKLFASRMQDAAVSAEIANAHDQAVRWGVDGTPTIIIDGKYRVLLTRSGGPSEMLRAADWLIARQRPLHPKQHARRAGKH